jgi:hypothetical protein
MSKRYLEVGVSRRQVTSVYLAVDEDDPRFCKAWSADWKERLRAAVAIAPFLADAAEETVEEYDWQVVADEPVNADSVREVTEQIARQYDVYEVLRA